jgi:hypothetical protein
LYRKNRKIRKDNEKVFGKKSLFAGAPGRPGVVFSLAVLKPG